MRLIIFFLLQASICSAQLSIPITITEYLLTEETDSSYIFHTEDIFDVFGDADPCNALSYVPFLDNCKVRTIEGSLDYIEITFVNGYLSLEQKRELAKMIGMTYFYPRYVDMKMKQLKSLIK